jgi:hypothetical protein
MRRVIEMKRLLLVIAIALVAIAAYFGYVQRRSPSSDVKVSDGSRSDSSLASAFKNHARNVQVQGRGVVTKILADDNDGSRHQRFVVRVDSGHIILIAHNVDIAPRIAPLREGDTVEFNGQYEWNPEGGVVHWTHHDPAGQHQAGWLKHNGQTFQ